MTSFSYPRLMETSPRILFLLISLTMGGSERKAVRIVNALRRRSHDIHLAYLNEPETLLGDVDPTAPTVHLGRTGKYSFGALKRLREYLVDHSISQIVCMNLYPFLYALPASWRMPNPIKCIVGINNTGFPNRKEALQMPLYSILLKRADRIVFGSKGQAQEWIEEFGLDRGRCMSIHNGVDENFFSPLALHQSRTDLRQEFGIAETDIAIGTVGQLRPEKRHEDLIHAVARLGQVGHCVKALIAGSGERRGELERLMRNLGVVDRVSLLGEQKDVRPMLTALDVFVLTSVSVETFSNAALEAMSMGLPTILSDIGGAREMVSPGVNGYIYSPGSRESLVETLLPLLGDAEKRKRLGDEARRRIREEFSFDRMLARYEDLLGLSAPA